MKSKKEMYLYGAIATTLVDVYYVFNLFLHAHERFTGLGLIIIILPLTGFAVIFWLLWIVKIVQSRMTKNVATMYTENYSIEQKHISPKKLRWSAVILIIVWLIMLSLPSDFSLMIEENLGIIGIFAAIGLLSPLLAGILFGVSFIESKTTDY